MEGDAPVPQARLCQPSPPESENVLVLEHFFLDATEPERMAILRPSTNDAPDYHSFCKRIREHHFHEHYFRGDTINIRLYTDEIEGLYGEEVRISEEAWQSVFRTVSKVIVRATSTIQDEKPPPPTASSRVQVALAMMWSLWERITSRLLFLVLILSVLVVSTTTVQ
ncbi:hypothetical protein FA13DRAFT_1800028 [Coprinellus micaceus]|uniref:Uncharacterized protein n=1 Tax=Coprinellus micaceus TaxID=71717 RepID=A0A4Y7SHE4_COPMI|nr:hypothetical protein FA13DRAFT_1800028 [Coprinellus micaceus]